ncbi:hypothetical protein GCM10010515_35420 [Streptomyces fructofermentans]|uniref:Uncharacterized protein n=1 Tax=Streptomyces fructofermentans TaxID=152141 RepID=A0A918NFS9_9ACTN|nr:hypothetical protein GCM10010515_35420 [Streptomyces fructofermentans]
MRYKRVCAEAGRGAAARSAVNREIHEPRPVKGMRRRTGSAPRPNYSAAFAEFPGQAVERPEGEGRLFR